MSDSAAGRYLALVGVVGERKAVHTGNFPLITEKMLPPADVVLLVVDDDPGAMLFRYTAYGEFGGDTWHPSPDEARTQAEYEFGDALGPWVELPDEVTDPHVYAVQYAADRINSRGKW